MEHGLTEEEIKKSVNDYYIHQGYTTKVAWGHSRGADIIAQKEGRRIVIEVKGGGAHQQGRANYFLAILGQILQRMDDPDCAYYIALPKMTQYRNLWERLPALAKSRTKIQMILVDDLGQLDFLTESGQDPNLYVRASS